MRSKRYEQMKETLESGAQGLSDAVATVKKSATANFDETVEIVVDLGVDPKKSDQMVRGNVVLPHGTGKQIRVAVAAEGPDVKKAEEAGADMVGKDEIISAVNDGNIDFDVLLATPECMKDLGRLGRTLGPRGLMPSPKSGTVVTDISEAVKRVKKGQIEFKMDKNGVLHGIIGKASFEQEKLEDNFRAYLEAVKGARPVSAKGRFIKKVVISATMGPSVTVNI